MSRPGGNVTASWWDDSELCTATYPGTTRDPRQLCDQKAGHAGNHRALAEIAFDYRRHIVWSVDGTVLPCEETSAPDSAQTPPTDGDQVT